MASKNKERRAAARLRGEESHARRDAGNAILMLWMSDAEGRVIYGDERMQAFWGPDLVGADLRDWSAAAHPDDAEEVAARLARALEPEGDLSLRARFRRGDGTYRFLRIEARPRRSVDGKLLGLLGASVDLTDVLEAERARREEEARYRAIVESQTEMVCRFRRDGTLVFVNSAYARSVGASVDELRGDSLWRVVPEDQRPHVEAMLSRLSPAEPEVRIEGWVASVHADDREPLLAAIAAAYDQRGPLSMEYRLRRHDGEHRWVLGKAVPLSAEGELTGYVGSAVDITEQKAAEEAQRDLARMLEERVAREIAEREKTEQQLRQAQKMESIGRLTGGVAHDFNNLLQIIGGSVQLVSEHIPIGDPAQERLRAAKEAVARGARLASQLLAFGRRQPLAPKPIHVGRLLRGLDEMLRPALGEGVEIETIVAGGLWNALVDPSQLENAVLNLAINGADAMGGYGKLTIEVVNAFLDDAYAALHDIAPGQYVMIAVTDTGRGIPAEIMDRVFEPFFTTKPEGQGTGLGLSMVYGFARQSGGHVKIYSEVGQGTTVRLYLPRTREAGVEALDRPQAPAQRGHETVLLVEDDAAVRETVAAMLADLGYTVLKAKDAQSAYAVIESGAPIDLLFTDVVMPGPMRSVDLARKARERLPDVAVLFTSGYTENAVVHGGRLDEGVDLLSKPYSQEALARKVRQVLSRRGAASSTAVAGRAPGASGGDPVEGLSVLLVEDEVLIRMATVQMLNDLGCSVVEAVSVEGALAALEAQPFDALITDIRLPGGSGFDLAIEARQRFPDLRIVLASGAQLDPGEEKRAQLSDVVGLPKPYDKAALTAALRKTI